MIGAIARPSENGPFDSSEEGLGIAVRWVNLADANQRPERVATAPGVPAGEIMLTLEPSCLREIEFILEPGSPAGWWHQLIQLPEPGGYLRELIFTRTSACP